MVELCDFLTGQRREFGVLVGVLGYALGTFAGTAIFELWAHF